MQKLQKKHCLTFLVELAFTIFFLFLFFGSKAENKCFNASPNSIVIDSKNFVLPSTQITVECWIKAKSFEQWSGPLSYVTDNYHEESGFAFSFLNNKLIFMLKTANMRGDEWNYNPGVELKVNQWNHIAATYDGESIKTYLNGELSDTKSVSGLINWDFKPANFHIGTFKDYNENYSFDGQIDEVRVWNLARSSSEINKFKNKRLSGKEEGLIAYYDFDNDNNTFIQDLSKNKNNGKPSLPTHEQIMIPSGAMIVPEVKNLDIQSPSSFGIEWETSESIFTYDYYLVEVSKERDFGTLEVSQKTSERKIILENVTGGSNIYVRIKAFSKDIGFTAYSEIFVIPNFGTALSIIVSSISEKSTQTRYKLVDYNVLMTDYISFPSKTKDIQFNFKQNNVVPEDISIGTIKINGPSRKYDATFSQTSDVTLFNLKAGKYDIDVEWGTNSGKSPLNVHLRMEIKPTFFQQTYIQVLLSLLLTIAIYFLSRKFLIISKLNLSKIKEQIPVREENTEWMNPDELEKKAVLIKDFVSLEKSFLDPKFNLKSLAENIDIPHYQISRILKEYYEMNFNDFINEFRVNEFINRLKDHKTKHIKNSALAYECGFYSESTFFRAFKKFMGKTPQQYQKDMETKDR